MVDVLVVAGERGEVPSRSTLELLGAARRLADISQGRVMATVLGISPSGLSASLFAYGADQVMRVEHPLLAACQADAYVTALTQVAGQTAAQVVLLADDSCYWRSSRNCSRARWGPRVSPWMRVGFPTPCKSGRRGRPLAPTFISPWGSPGPANTGRDDRLQDHCSHQHRSRGADLQGGTSRYRR